MRSSSPGSVRLPVVLTSAGALALLALAMPGAIRAQERPPAETMARVVESVEELDRLRSQLAGAFLNEGVQADSQTFQAVCKPVKMKALSLAEDQDWQIEQLAIKYRSPDNEAGAEARLALDLMRERPELEGLWGRSRRGGRAGFLYQRRITVEPACLACHGHESDRPRFVKENYPDDRAFGFAAGDLRGLYSVFVPLESQMGAGKR